MREEVVIVERKKPVKRRGTSHKAPVTQQLRNYGLPENLARCGAKILRYKNPIEKGVYWYFFSLHVRKRDVEKYGTCISCGRPITVDACDAGHFMPASSCGLELLFDLRNVNAECTYCNGFDETHLLGYAEGLDKRYGAGTAYSLRKRRDEYRTSPPQKGWTKQEYVEKIDSLRKDMLV